MTTVVQFPARRDGHIPADSFPIRLAIVRASMGGWNYDEAARATGINSETWRLWEKGKRRCTTLEQTCRKIAAATGISYEWLMVGGALDTPDPSGPLAQSVEQRTFNPGSLGSTAVILPFREPRAA